MFVCLRQFRLCTEILLWLQYRRWEALSVEVTFTSPPGYPVHGRPRVLLIFSELLLTLIFIHCRHYGNRLELFSVVSKCFILHSAVIPAGKMDYVELVYENLISLVCTDCILISSSPLSHCIFYIVNVFVLSLRGLNLKLRLKNSSLNLQLII